MFLNRLKRNKIRAISLVAKSVERQLFYGNPYFLSNAEVSMMVSDWCKDLAKEKYDLILGILRSGMFIASMISLNLAIPLSTTDLFKQGTIWKSTQIQDREIKRILLVDDTFGTGKTMTEEQNKLNEIMYKIDTAALFVTEKGVSNIDKYYSIMPEPILGEWNFRHQKIGIVGFDMDGVLCEDCPIGSDDNEEKYIKFLNNAGALYIPSFTIDYIITSRLEKYRKETEEWLNKNNVKYSNLIMWDVPDKSYRLPGEAAKFKSYNIKKYNIDYYIESGKSEAEFIWDNTNVPVICTENMRMYNELWFNKKLLTKARGTI